MPKEEPIKIQGVVKESLPNATFRVEIQGGHLVLARVCGKMRVNFIRILLGDVVTIEVSPYDIARGRIVYRGPQKDAMARRGPRRR